MDRELAFFLKLFRILLIGVALLSFNVSESQNLPNLSGTWIEQDNILKINDTLGKESILLINYDTMKCVFYANKLGINFISENNINDGLKKTIKENFDLKIVKSTEKQLYIVPISNWAKLENWGKDTLKFTNKEYLIDKTIKLEKIIFHSSYCMGRCPFLDIEIDSNKKVYYRRQKYKIGPNTIDRNFSGNFKGSLSDSSYKKLINLLQTCELKDLKFINAVEGQEITLIVYFNGQRKYLHSIEYPRIAKNLIYFLFNIKKEADMKQTMRKFKIEK